MKKWLSVLVTVILVLSMATAFAAPSKTTSDLAKAVGMTLADGTTSSEPVVIIVPDTTMTLEEVEKLYKHVSGGENAVSYFDDDTQKAILETLNKDATSPLVLDDLKDWEIDEFVTVDDNKHDESMGDVKVQFQVATPYEPDQKLVAMIGNYDGTRTEVAPNVFEFNSEWSALEASVVENTTDGSVVEVTFTKDDMVKMGENVSTAMAFLSEPVKK